MESEATLQHARGTLVFDGDCSFCTSAVEWITRNVPAPPSVLPWQRCDLEALGLTRDEAAEMVWLVLEDRKGISHQYGGYLAVSVMLRHQPRPGWRFLGILLDTPPFSPLANLGYRMIARFRHLLPGGTPVCQVGQDG